MYSDNWALGMPTEQSSTQVGHKGDKVVDGRDRCTDSINDFFYTALPDKNPWWMVHLKNTILVREVEIFNSVPCCGKFLLLELCINWCMCEDDMQIEETKR